MTIEETIGLYEANSIDFGGTSEIILEALKKQLPKEVDYALPMGIKAFDQENRKVVVFKCAPCPVCGKWLTANMTHKYCQYCGQALDWQEVLNNIKGLKGDRE